MKIGRPTMLTDEVSKAICDNLMLCMTRVDAALQVGISPRTLTDWMARGQAGEEPYAQLYVEVGIAELTAQRRLLGQVVTGASRDPRHAEWLLTHRWPRVWGERQAVPVPHRRNPRKPAKGDDE